MSAPRLRRTAISTLQPRSNWTTIGPKWTTFGPIQNKSNKKSKAAHPMASMASVGESSGGLPLLCVAWVAVALRVTEHYLSRVWGVGRGLLRDGHLHAVTRLDSNSWTPFAPGAL